MIAAIVRRASLGLAAALGCASPCAAAARAGIVPLAYAGDGISGILDGPAPTARFVEPIALASGPGGALYIADAGAQRIRVLRAGRVATVAGSGALDVATATVRGGYADGPANLARFERPSGIAVGPDGALYVADAGNHCIRRIAAGSVSTYAGVAARAGRDDGPRETATFAEPRALAFDTAGDLFVADYGVGIREISQAGTVSTYATIPNVPQTFVALAAYGSGSRLVVYASNLAGIVVYRNAAPGWRYDFTKVEGESPLGVPVALDAVDDHAALYLDRATHALRLYRSPMEPFVTTPFGGTVADAFVDPAAVATVARGTVAVADAAAHRILSVGLPNLRQPASSSVDLDVSPSDYRIVLLSNSFAAWDSFWDRSVGGLLERRLRERRARIALPRVAHVDAMRIDGSTIATTLDYANDTLAGYGADLVIFDLNLAHVFAPAAGPQMPLDPAFADGIARRLRETRASLAAAGIAFVVLVQPTGNVAARGRAPSAVVDAFSAALSRAVALSGVLAIDLTQPESAYERTAAGPALFGADGVHLTARGNAMTADALLGFLERTKPWLASAAPATLPKAP